MAEIRLHSNDLLKDRSTVGRIRDDTDIGAHSVHIILRAIVIVEDVNVARVHTEVLVECGDQNRLDGSGISGNSGIVGNQVEINISDITRSTQRI